MYKCSVCGNMQYFTELKNIATTVICDDEGNPVPYLCQDILLSLVEVYCTICKSSTEDNLILGDDGEPLELPSPENPPDIGYSG
jgi:hypothetical protein